MAVADFADATEIARHGRHGAGGGAHHGFCHERHDRAGAQALEGLFQFPCQALAVLFGTFAFALVAVGVAGRDMLDFDQQRRELCAAPRVAAHCQRTQRVAVIALPARDDVAAFRLADFHEVLPRHLQSGFHGLRAARHEIGVRNALRGVRYQPLGQPLGYLGREEAGVGIGQRVDLRMHGGLDVRMIVPQAGDRGAAGSVEIGAAGVVVDPYALAADGDGGRLAQ